MKDNKYTELLEQYFEFDKNYMYKDSYDDEKQYELRLKILEIQKQRDVEAKIERFKTFLNTYQLTQFEELLKAMDWIK